MSSATSASACRRPSTRTSAASPAVHSLMRMGMNAYLGPLRDREAKLDYVNFYAHLHRLVDEKIGRLVEALGDRRRPGLAALAHGRRPLRRPRRDGPLARRPAPEDVQRLRGDDQRPARRLEPGAVPRAGRDRRARLAGRRPADAADPRRARAPAGEPARPRPDPGPRADADPRRPRAGDGAGVDLAPVCDHPAPAASVQDAIHFTYDDHQAGDRDAGGARPAEPHPRGPHRRRKYALYFDPQRPRRPSTSSTTSAATPWRRTTCSGSGRGFRGPPARALFGASSPSASIWRWSTARPTRTGPLPDRPGRPFVFAG